MTAGNDQPTVSHVEAAPQKETASEQPTILYVEDDPMSREVMQILLVDLMGYSDVTILEDSTDFLTKVEALKTPPKVIFLDIHMQPVNGFDMLKLLRAHERYRTTTVVALTASVMNEEVNLLRNAGFDSCIAKPIDQRAFPEVLTRILNGERFWRIK
jgi:CheY-like chemotaxis protein